MTTSPLPQPNWSGMLSDLSGVDLQDHYEDAYQRSVSLCHGAPVWRRRKLIEYREFLALAQVSRRITPIMADLSGPLRLMFEMAVPVPTMPEPDGDLVVRDRCVLGLIYPEEAIRVPLPGYAFVSTIKPSDLFLANAAPADAGPALAGAGQAICLGSEIGASTPVKEIVLRTYGALTLQSVQLDESDAAGVMNRPAAAWWIQNRHRMPLTREGFLEFDPSNNS